MYQCPQCQYLSLQLFDITHDARRHVDMPDMQDDAVYQAQAEKLLAHRVYVSSRDPGVSAAGRL